LGIPSASIARISRSRGVSGEQGLELLFGEQPVHLVAFEPLGVFAFKQSGFDHGREGGVADVDQGTRRGGEFRGRCGTRDGKHAQGQEACE
jgi:hypothetical protein